MARRAIAPTLRPIQLWNNCRLQVLVGGSASWTLPWRELKNRRQPPQSEKPEATQNRRQADTSEPPARTTPHQRTNTPHSDGVSGFALFSHCGSPSVAPHQTGGARLSSLHVKFACSTIYLITKECHQSRCSPGSGPMCQGQGQAALHHCSNVESSSTAPMLKPAAAGGITAGWMYV